MQTITDIGALIVRTPGICGGRPRIAETRVSVQRGKPVDIPERLFLLTCVWGSDDLRFCAMAVSTQLVSPKI